MVIFSIQVLVRFNFFFLNFCLIFGSKGNCIVFKSPCLSYKGRVLFASPSDIVVRVSVNFVSCNFSQAKTKNAIV